MRILGNVPNPVKRKSAHQRGYTKDWARAAKVFLREHPLCLHCQKLGRLIPANQVDHIKPWRGDRELFWARENWQPLCQSCHSRKTNNEDRGRDKPQTGVDGAPVGWK
jgi:5-methylcytosine-specific restriction protein A